MWLGFCAVLVAPSPKFQDHEVGDPADVSVNCTTCPALGDGGDQVKLAAGGSGSVDRVRTLKVAPDAFETTRLTENDAASV